MKESDGGGSIRGSRGKKIRTESDKTEPKDEKIEDKRQETMYREHWEHARHCEREIFWFTNIYAVVVAAILAFMKQMPSRESGLVLVLVAFGFILSVFGLLIVISLTQGHHIYIMNIITICYRWNVMEFYANPGKTFYYKRVHRWFFEFSIVLFEVLFLFYASQEWASLEVFHEFWILLIIALVSLIIIKGLYRCIWDKYSWDCRDYKEVLRNDIDGYYRNDWDKWFKGPRFWKKIVEDARTRDVLKQKPECMSVGKLCWALEKLDYIYKTLYEILCGHPPKKGLLPPEEDI